MTARFTTFTAAPLFAADVNAYLMRQVIIRCDTTADLDTIPAPEAGQCAVVGSGLAQKAFTFDGTAWVPMGCTKWQPITPAAGYTALSAWWRLENSGTSVRLRGAIKRDSGTLVRATALATLPAAACPPIAVHSPAGVGTGTSTPNVTRATVSSTGALSVGGDNTSLSSGGATTLYLDGVTYAVDPEPFIE